MPDQPSLFETPVPRPAHVHREEFLSGMLAVWLLGEGRKPSKVQRDELMKLSRRYLSDCELVVGVHLTTPSGPVAQ
jgi:hypothetical protein